jgi:hypothetical protein
VDRARAVAQAPVEALVSAKVTDLASALALEEEPAAALSGRDQASPRRAFFKK